MLELDRVHLLGHSSGSQIAVDYALMRPEGVESYVLANPPLSIPRWLADLARYRAALPPEVQEVLDRCEAAGETPPWRRGNEPLSGAGKPSRGAATPREGVAALPSMMPVTYQS